jgi:hypothetical protein
MGRILTISIDDPQRDKKIMINSFMKELCRLDNEANTGQRIDIGGNQNVFSVEEIRQQVLDGFTDIEHVQQFLRGHRLENRGNEPFEFLDNEQNVRLTDAGRARCNEYGL